MSKGEIEFLKNESSTFNGILIISKIPCVVGKVRVFVEKEKEMKVSAFFLYCFVLRISKGFLGVGL